MDAATQYALAYALTTTAGVRGVLALTLVSIATTIGYLHPPAAFSWLAEAPVMWALIAVSLADLLADKVPMVDHVLHVAQIVVKPAAAVIIVGGTVHAQTQEMLIVLMVLGALNALGVHAGVASVRAASTATSGGMLNPLVSVTEDVGALTAGILAFFAPYVVAAIALVLAIFYFTVLRKAFTKSRA